MEEFTMATCPKCKSKLNIDEKSSGRCFACGTIFESSLPKEDKQINYMSFDNTVAKLIECYWWIAICWFL